jgi:hypothetical protein
MYRASTRYSTGTLALTGTLGFYPYRDGARWKWEQKKDGVSIVSIEQEGGIIVSISQREERKG